MSQLLYRDPPGTFCVLSIDQSDRHQIAERKQGKVDGNLKAHELKWFGNVARRNNEKTIQEVMNEESEGQVEQTRL